MPIASQIANKLMRPIVQRRARLRWHPSSKINWVALWKTRAGEIAVGEKSIINCKIAFDHPNGKVIIGNRVYIGASLLVCHTGISIADDVIISWGVTIVDHDSHSLNWAERAHDVEDWYVDRKNWKHVTVRPVSIEDRVWIGFGASVLKGVTIGRGAVVAARSVVTKDVPPGALVAGNPARIIRQLDAGEKAISR